MLARSLSTTSNNRWEVTNNTPSSFSAVISPGSYTHTHHHLGHVCEVFIVVRAPYYYIRVSMFIYLVTVGFFRPQQKPKRRFLTRPRSFVDSFFFFVSEKVVGWWKKVKYYFPPPLFEFSELNRISFRLFCFCFVCRVLYIYIYYFILF